MAPNEQHRHHLETCKFKFLGQFPRPSESETLMGGGQGVQQSRLDDLNLGSAMTTRGPNPVHCLFFFFDQVLLEHIHNHLCIISAFVLQWQG